MNCCFAVRFVIHFIGGAFLGAAPQLTYRLFLSTLATQLGAVVVASPYALSYDRIAAADEAYLTFKNVQSTFTREWQDLPVIGIGHSLGCILHLLIATDFQTSHIANILMSYNNRPPNEFIEVEMPALLPFLGPFGSNLGRIFTAQNTSPFKGELDRIRGEVRQNSPKLVREIAPIIEQLETLLAEDQSSGSPSPSPEDTMNRVQNLYKVEDTLLVKFKSDTIDQTEKLAEALANEAIPNKPEGFTESSPGSEPVKVEVEDAGIGYKPQITSGEKLSEAEISATPSGSTASSAAKSGDKSGDAKIKIPEKREFEVLELSGDHVRPNKQLPTRSMSKAYDAGKQIFDAAEGFAGSNSEIKSGLDRAKMLFDAVTATAGDPQNAKRDLEDLVREIAIWVEKNIPEAMEPRAGSQKYEEFDDDNRFDTAGE